MENNEGRNVNQTKPTNNQLIVHYEYYHTTGYWRYSKASDAGIERRASSHDIRGQKTNKDYESQEGSTPLLAWQSAGEACILVNHADILVVYHAVHGDTRKTPGWRSPLTTYLQSKDCHPQRHASADGEAKFKQLTMKKLIQSLPVWGKLWGDRQLSRVRGSSSDQIRAVVLSVSHQETNNLLKNYSFIS